MKYKIELYGKGNEFCIGTVSDEIWNYIQNECSGDVSEYLERLDDGEVPEELRLAEDRLAIRDECDDLFHKTGVWSNGYIMTVTDESNETVLCMTYEEVGDDRLIEKDTVYESVDSSGKHIVTYSDVLKGALFFAEVDVDGDFDKSRLKVQYHKVCYADDEYSNTVVDCLFYDGEELEDMGGDWDCKGTDIDVF